MGAASEGATVGKGRRDGARAPWVDAPPMRSGGTVPYRFEVPDAWRSRALIRDCHPGPRLAELRDHVGIAILQTKRHAGSADWTGPDDAPELTVELRDKAEEFHGDASSDGAADGQSRMPRRSACGSVLSPDRRLNPCRWCAG